ncbi:MAG: 1-deoxy-D-xylulose-5-phosphate reductoisomerase [candidate division WOR-3 bacterium]
MNIFVFGATGSIGKNFFSLLKKYPELKPVGIQAHKNERKLLELKKKFNIDFAFITGKIGENKEIIYDREKLKDFVNSNRVEKILFGAGGIDLADIFLEILNSGKRVCMANKEIIIAFGEIIKNKNLTNLIPVDSEHSSIFRILKNIKKDELKKIIITASGGPFYNIKNSKLSKISVREALRHPRWKMGKKITIDSATLINKGFEVIEAHYLFDIEPEKIDVLYHPESKVHGMVLLKDGTYIAHIGETDMRIPILYALFYPEIKEYKGLKKFYEKLNFKKLKREKRKLIDLCFKALKEKRGKPAFLIGADEELVNLFLKGKIKFPDIERILLKIYKKAPHINDRNFNEIMKIIEISKNLVYKEIK